MLWKQFNKIMKYDCYLSCFSGSHYYQIPNEKPSLETSIFPLSFQVVREPLPFAYHWIHYLHWQCLKHTLGTENQFAATNAILVINVADPVIFPKEMDKTIYIGHLSANSKLLFLN